MIPEKYSEQSKNFPGKPLFINDVFIKTGAVMMGAGTN